MQMAANWPASCGSWILAEAAGRGQHVVEPARRHAGHVLARPPSGREGDQELAGSRVQVVDEERRLSRLGDRLRGAGPDADHVDQIAGDLLVLVLGQQAPGLVGVVDRRRQELDLRAALDQLARKFSLPGLVVIGAVGPGWLPGRDVREDQPHLAAAAPSTRACPRPRRPRRWPHSRWPGRSRRSGSETAAVHAACLSFDNVQSMIDGHGRTSPVLNRSLRTGRRKARLFRWSRNDASPRLSKSSTRLTPRRSTCNAGGCPGIEQAIRWTRERHR